MTWRPGGANFGSGRVMNSIEGDSGFSGMTGQVRGGDDVLVGGDNHGAGEMTNLLLGDTHTMSGDSHGGDDTLIGGSNTGVAYNVANILVGDASEMCAGARGGNDTLIAGANVGSVEAFFSNVLTGDAEILRGSAKGGDDRLIGAERTKDDLWGDGRIVTDTASGGADVFVFRGEFGADLIWDFRRDDGDRIEFEVKGVADFSDLTIAREGRDLVITAAGGTVTLVEYGDAPTLTRG